MFAALLEDAVIDASAHTQIYTHTHNDDDRNKTVNRSRLVRASVNDFLGNSKLSHALSGIELEGFTMALNSALFKCYNESYKITARNMSVT